MMDVEIRGNTKIGFWALVVLALTILAAWIQHIIWIISALASNDGATFGQIALGVIGAFMPPVGIIHGVMIWFEAGMG